MKRRMPDEVKRGVAVVTGASGFIGGRLRDKLLDEGWDVVALTRPSSPAPKRGRAAAVDYADPESLAAVLKRERPDVVFHVAGATKGVTYDDFQRANVMPTRNLALALSKAHDQVGRLLNVSSLTAYGPSTPEQPLIETHTPAPLEHYGRSKLAAERVLLDEIGTQLPWTTIRPAGVYGPGDVDYFELFRLASRGLNVFYGNRDYWFSAVHVDDVVRAIIDAARSDATIGKGYFICDGKPLTWFDYQQHVVEAVGKRALNLHLPEFTLDVAAAFGEMLTRFDGKPRVFNRQKVLMGKQRAWTCKHDAARADFGYAPKLSVREGVTHTLDWYRSAGWL
jgi:nucleoside-diphosphate-sugar epimerase